MTTTTTNPAYKRGEIILVLFPHSDLQTAKLRPALIVQADELNTNLPQVIVAMITSNMSRSGHPSRISILLSSEEGKQSGLLTDSVIATDNLTTIRHSEIDRVIGSIPMTDVDEALKHTLALQ